MENKKRDSSKRIFTEYVCTAAIKLVEISQLLQEVLDIIPGDAAGETYPVVSYLWDLVERTEGPIKETLKSFTASVHTAGVHYQVRGYSQQTFREIRSLIEKDMRSIKKAKIRIVS